MKSVSVSTMWIVIGNLEGAYHTPDGKNFENTQVIARVTTLPDENVWEAIVRQAESDNYIKELLSYRSYREKGRWEPIVAYELTGVRLEPESQDARRFEPLPV